MQSRLLTKNFEWRLLLLLLTGLLIWGIVRHQNHRLINHDVGGFKTEEAGERVAVSKLAEVTSQGRGRGLIRISWNVVKPTPTSTNKRSLEVWFYGLTYDRQKQRVIHYIVSPRSTDVNQVEATQYDAVSRVVIKATAQSNGISSNFVEHGATLVQKGKATFVEGRGPVFERG